MFFVIISVALILIFIVFCNSLKTVVYQVNLIYIDSKSTDTDNFETEFDTKLCSCRQEIGFDRNTFRKFKSLDQDKLSTTSCGISSMIKRGFNQKVISVSLNNYKDFKTKIESLSMMVSDYLPDWSIRIYHDNKLSESDKCDLLCNNEEFRHNIDICSINDFEKQLATVLSNDIKNNQFIWKWLPIGDYFVDYFLSVDLENIIIPKFYEKIEEWMYSDKHFFIIRDEPNYAIQDTLWGFKNVMEPSFSKMIFNKFLTLQNINAESSSNVVLNYIFGENILDKALIHDTYYCEQFGTFPFPTNVKPNYFCSLSCLNCCKISPKNMSQVYECPDGCSSTKKIPWGDCIDQTS